MSYLDIVIQQKHKLEEQGKTPKMIVCNPFVLEQLKAEVNYELYQKIDSKTLFGLAFKIDNDKELEVV